MARRALAVYHAHLAAALNLKLLQAREVVDAAVAAYRAGAAPLASVEGFVRQILGWREYVRGIYWTRMPGYAELNALDAHEDLPAWYWTGATDMAYLRAKGVQCYGIGPATDSEDGPKGFGAHSDQERILESELFRFVRFNWDAVVDLARAR